MGHATYLPTVAVERERRPKGVDTTAFDAAIERCARAFDEVLLHLEDPREHVYGTKQADRPKRTAQRTKQEADRRWRRALANLTRQRRKLDDRAIEARAIQAEEDDD